MRPVYYYSFGPLPWDPSEAAYVPHSSSQGHCWAASDVKSTSLSLALLIPLSPGGWQLNLPQLNCHEPCFPEGFLRGNLYLTLIFLVKPFVNCCPLIAKSCSTLCDPLDCSPPGSSVHGISQARVLERGTIASSRGSSQPRDRTHTYASPALQADALPLSHRTHPFAVNKAVKAQRFSEFRGSLQQITEPEGNTD